MSTFASSISSAPMALIQKQPTHSCSHFPPCNSGQHLSSPRGVYELFVPPLIKDSHPRAPHTSGQPPRDSLATLGITPGTCRPQTLVDAPTAFHSSSLFPNISVLTGVSWVPWAAPHSFKTRNKAQSQQKRHQWLHGWETYTSEARSWRDTPLCAAEGGESGTWRQRLLAGRGTVTIYRGN